MPSFSEDWLRNISKALSIFIKHFNPPKSDYEFSISKACTHMDLGRFVIPSELDEMFSDLVKLGLNFAKVRKYLTSKLQFLVSASKYTYFDDIVLDGD
jgi:hypothetical protein